MIISASRRTDIPAYYSDWFFERIAERFVFVKNPMNSNQIRRVDLSPELIDCIVFWSKNPLPMLDKLDLINEYHYYFQFTITPYGDDIETKLPPKNEIIETFIRLAEKIGAHRVIWRYDPILVNDKYNIAYHVENFNKIACRLRGSTKKATISFIDFYKKIDVNIKKLGIKDITIDEKKLIAKSLSKIAFENDLLLDTCAEDIDLPEYGIFHAMCIDDDLISKITGHELKVKKDKNQRLECGCVSSVDIGVYNSCLSGCLYCYANSGKSTAIS